MPKKEKTVIDRISESANVKARVKDLIKSLDKPEGLLLKKEERLERARRIEYLAYTYQEALLLSGHLGQSAAIQTLVERYGEMVHRLESELGEGETIEIEGVLQPLESEYADVFKKLYPELYDSKNEKN
jgi:hypothetical protein